MSIETIQLIIQLTSMLISAGIKTAEELKPLFAQAGLSDADMNTILDGVIADATARKAQAQADADAATPSKPTP